MATYTTNAHIAKVDDLEEGWGLILSANYDLIDSWAPIRTFACITNEDPSTTLQVQVKGGNYKRVGQHQLLTAANVTLTLPASSTVSVYCLESGITSGPAYPTQESYVPIATVSTNDSAIIRITDDRCPYLITGFEITAGLDYLDDAAAGIAGVRVGELYHTGGVLKIRRS